MALEIIDAPPTGATEPPVIESLRGVATRVVDLPFLPPPVPRKPGEAYFEFEDDTPPPEDFVHFTDKEGNPIVRIYCEPYNPGLELMPYARVQSIASTVEGQWVCRCKAEEDAVRERLRQYGGNPERYRLTERHIKDAQDPQKITNCGTCRFQTTRTEMWNLHRNYWGHQ